MKKIPTRDRFLPRQLAQSRWKKATTNEARGCGIAKTVKHILHILRDNHAGVLFLLARVLMLRTFIGDCQVFCNHFHSWQIDGATATRPNSNFFLVSPSYAFELCSGESSISMSMRLSAVNVRYDCASIRSCDCSLVFDFDFVERPSFSRESLESNSHL